MVYNKVGLPYYMRKLDSFNLDKLCSGNMSLRLDNGLIAIKPTGFSYDEVDLEDISVVDLNTGELISGKKPSSDLNIHLEIYRKKDDVDCIIHTHSHYATVMGCLNKPLQVLTTLHADYFGKEIFCMPYVNHRTDNIGKYAVESNENIMLLERHGTLLFGSDIDKLIKNAVILEEISKLNFNILSSNNQIKPLGVENIDSLNNYYHTEYGK